MQDGPIADLLGKIVVSFSIATQFVATSNIKVPIVNKLSPFKKCALCAKPNFGRRRKDPFGAVLGVSTRTSVDMVPPCDPLKGGPGSRLR